MIDSVVDLVEEQVDLDGSQFSEYELDLEVVGSIGNFQIVARLLIVEHVLNPILFSIRVSMRSLAEVEVTCILFRI